MTRRSVGVEEELLLVDRDTGVARAVAPSVLARVAARERGSPEAGGEAGPDERHRDEPGGTVDHELQREQIEVDTVPHTDLGELREELLRHRRQLAEDAAAVGAAPAALATSPLPVQPTAYPNPRYEAMVELYGPTGQEQLVCGTHVHVATEDDEESVAVIDRIRPWLSVLLALSANSPYWQGQDTAYQSFRSTVWARWPTAGPSELFGSVHVYRDTVAALVRTGAVLDDGMVYWEARLGRGYPTVEIRAADVCGDVRDAAALAALCRALVDTAAQDWRAGRPAAPVATGVLRLASWRAGRSGTTGRLLHPHSLVPAPAWDVVAALRAHVGAALRAAGDTDDVDERLAAIRTGGSGATAQRRAYDATDSLADVVRDAVDRTTAG